MRPRKERGSVRVTQSIGECGRAGGACPGPTPTPPFKRVWLQLPLPPASPPALEGRGCASILSGLPSYFGLQTDCTSQRMQA